MKIKQDEINIIIIFNKDLNNVLHKIGRQNEEMKKIGKVFPDQGQNFQLMDESKVYR